MPKLIGVQGRYWRPAPTTWVCGWQSSHLALEIRPSHWPSTGTDCEYTGHIGREKRRVLRTRIRQGDGPASRPRLHIWEAMANYFPRLLRHPIVMFL